MSDLTAFTDKYRQNLIIRNYAPRTIYSRLAALNRFLEYLKAMGVEGITAVAKDTIRDYQTHLFEEISFRGRPNTVVTQNGLLGGVKAFFRYLHENDYIVSDPSRDIPYAREPKRLPRSILTSTEAKKVLHAPDTKTVLGYRDRTILEVLYSTGIRKEEIRNLLISDVDYKDGFIRINAGKGNKDRVVPLGKIACRYLENYIKGIRPALEKERNDHLFLSMRGNKLSKNMIWDIVKGYSKKAKLKKTVSPHTFRHTCATLMLRNKANIRHIQELLGHSSLDTTQVYAQVSITDLKEVHSKCHPREKDQD